MRITMKNKYTKEEGMNREDGKDCESYGCTEPMSQVKKDKEQGQINEVLQGGFKGIETYSEQC